MYKGVIVEALVLVIFAVVGHFIGERLPERVRKACMQMIGVVVLYLGISGASDSKNLIVLLMSLLLGTIIGEFINIEGALDRGSKAIQNKVASGEEASLFAEGFVTASLVICVGAMTVLGALQSGLNGDHSLLYTKSVIVAVSSLIFGSTYGIGAAFAALSVLIYEGGLVTLAAWIAPYLTPDVVAEMSGAGSIILVGLGLNMLEITDIRVTYQIPAIFMPILLLPLYNLF